MREFHETWREITGQSPPGNIGGGCLWVFVLLFGLLVAAGAAIWTVRLLVGASGP